MRRYRLIGCILRCGNKSDPVVCRKIIRTTMPAARRNRNGSLRPSAAAFPAAALLTVLIASLVSAATTERVVVDPRTGLAIHGFDPVAYFTDAIPSAGREELEVAYAGAVWRFRRQPDRIHARSGH